MGKLRNLLMGAGVAVAGGVGTKLAVDYFRNRGKEEEVPEMEEDPEPTSAEEVAYANVQDSSLQSFLDASFGAPGRYVPTRPAKVFEYQGESYMKPFYGNDLK